MKPLTKATFSQSKELISAAQNLMLCQAHEQMVRPVVEAYENAILAQHAFPAAEKWREHHKERILDRKSSFLLSGEDSKTFFAECNAAREAAGLKISAPGNCPLLEAEHLRVQAENAFIKELGSIEGLASLAKAHMTLDERAKVIDLGLKLTAPFVGTAETILQGLTKG